MDRQQNIPHRRHRRDRRATGAERYKCSPCEHFSNNNVCPRGIRCKFYHGAADKRTVAQNREMGLTTDEAVDAHIARLVAEDSVARARAFAALCQTADFFVTDEPRRKTRYAYNPYAGVVTSGLPAPLPAPAPRGTVTLPTVVVSDDGDLCVTVRFGRRGR